MDRMGEWVQDALDAIEYANGPTNSVWGRDRAAAGHPAPFNLNYMEIGNENGTARIMSSIGRCSINAIRAKYPEHANSWPTGWGRIWRLPRRTWWMTITTTRPNGSCAMPTQYDQKDRNGPKVFVGEYAVTKTRARAICAAPSARRRS